MTSLGMTSCMTSLFRVTSPVTRSVVKTSGHSIPGCEWSGNCGFLGNQNDGEHPCWRWRWRRRWGSPQTTSGVLEFSEHGVRGSRVKKSLEKSQNKRNSRPECSKNIFKTLFQLGKIWKILFLTKIKWKLFKASKTKNHLGRAKSTKKTLRTVLVT